MGEPNKRPSCIELIVTDQPNIALYSGTRAFLDTHCHHHIIYGKVNFKTPPSPSSERKIWHYHRDNTDGVQRSMANFLWLE